MATTASAATTTKISTNRSTALKRLLNQNTAALTTLNELFDGKKQKIDNNFHDSMSSPALSTNDDQLDIKQENQYFIETNEDEADSDLMINNNNNNDIEIKIDNDNDNSNSSSTTESTSSLFNSIKRIETNQNLLMLKMDLIIETFKYFQSNYVSKNKFKNCMKNVYLNDNVSFKKKKKKKKFFF
jgi:hypothetical protein